jgi:hypothetical protein
MAHATHFVVRRGPMVDQMVPTDADGNGEQGEM